MRKLIYLLVFFFLVSCNEKEEFVFVNSDKFPTILLIEILDKDSVNILNDSITRNEYMENMKIIYRDSVFCCSGVTKQYDSDYSFNGKNSLSNIEFWAKDYYNKDWRPYTYYAFWFGSFAPNQRFENELVIIDWGDGTTDEIKFTYTENTSIWILNGKKVENAMFTFVRE